MPARSQQAVESVKRFYKFKFVLNSNKKFKLNFYLKIIMTSFCMLFTVCSDHLIVPQLPNLQVGIQNFSQA